MSAVSASIPAPPIVSISTMGGATGTGSNTVAVSAGGPRVGPIPGSSPIGSAGTPVGKCCENGRPVSTDPLTGQTICSCQYNPSALLMAASCYPRGVGVGMPGLSDAAAGVYSNPYATAAMQGLLPATAGADPTAFYSSMGLQGSGYYAYDPFSAYPYGNGFVMDPNARRKNATRESTQTLKAWLSEHRKNPYPTKGEKIMLAIITKMTLTQVSTWFANARRRLKKENKMTWSPRNRCGEDDDLDNDDLDDDKLNGDENDTNNNKDFDQSDDDGDVDIMNCPADRDSFVHSVDFRKACTLPLGPKGDDDINVLDDTEDEKDGKDRLGSAFTLVSPNRLPPGLNGHGIPSPTSDSERMRDSSCHKLTSPTTTTKPKIWSVADVVSKSNDESRTSDSEHSPTRSPIQHTPPHPLNGHHMPHPAFPTGAPPHMAARGMGLWNPSVVTSLAGMAAAGRYHPYSQALFSHPGAAGATTAASRAGPFSAMVPPGLLGSHQHHHTGALRQHVLGQQATDLRKISQLQSNNGRSSTGSPESKPMTSLGGRLPSSEGQGQRSRSTSPTPATAFKPVARSN